MSLELDDDGYPKEFDESEKRLRKKRKKLDQQNKITKLESNVSLDTKDKDEDFFNLGY